MNRILISLRKIGWAGLAWLVFAPSEIHSQTGLVESAKPLETKIAGFDKAFCVEAKKIGRVCKGLISGDDAPENARFFVEFGGKNRASWNAAAFLGDVARFEVWSGDLDGDSKNELIVVNYDGQSNGMGVTYQTVYILPLAAQNDADDSRRAPLRFSAEDFSAADGFAKNAQTGNFEILVSNWEWSWQAKNKKEGLYLIGRFFIYKDGALVPSAKPLVVRRYTKKFERQRLNDLENAKIPAKWLGSADSENRNADLMNVSETETILSGTIEKSESAAGLILNIRKDDGKNQALEYQSERGDSQTLKFSFFGDEKTRRIYPKNYLPANAATDLNGKKVRVVRYKSRTAGDFDVLWLLENK